MRQTLPTDFPGLRRIVLQNHSLLRCQQLAGAQNLTGCGRVRRRAEIGMRTRGPIPGQSCHLRSQRRQADVFAGHSGLVQPVQKFPGHRQRLLPGLPDNGPVAHSHAHHDATLLVPWEIIEPGGHIGRFVLPDIEDPGGDGDAPGRRQKRFYVPQHLVVDSTRNPQRTETQFIELGGSLRRFSLVAEAQLHGPEADLAESGCTHINLPGQMCQADSETGIPAPTSTPFQQRITETTVRDPKSTGAEEQSSGSEMQLTRRRDPATSVFRKLDDPIQHGIPALLPGPAPEQRQPNMGWYTRILVNLTVVSPVDFIGKGQEPAVGKVALEGIGKNPLGRLADQCKARVLQQ